MATHHHTPWGEEHVHSISTGKSLNKTQTNSNNKNPGRIQIQSCQKEKVNQDFLSQNYKDDSENAYIIWIQEIPKNLPKTSETDEFSKVTGCKMNIYTSIVLLQNRNENIKTESKNTIPFTIAKKRNAIGVNLTQKKLDINLANVALSPVICGHAKASLSLHHCE